MKKIVLATIGLALFATPLAAQDPYSGYSVTEQQSAGATDFGAFNHPQGSGQLFIAPPYGTSQSFGVTATPQSFGLAPSRPHVGFGSSTAHTWPNQDLRDRYGRISH